ncbi:hypothetical protein C8R43DRAFT_1133106 [Mycena crocata]|nr:hypothetical protein C8R43DRAFT_1133106 [Mycena crocata]
MSPRFLWFFLGAGVGTWWATHKNMRVDCHVQRTLASSPVPQNSSESQLVQELRTRPMTQFDRGDVWGQERERVKHFGQSAEDTVAELSEVTLNTILHRCAAWVGSDVDPDTGTPIPRMVPTHPLEICILCNHPWISHNDDNPCQDPSHINFVFRRGGFASTNCGGFHSDQERWSFLTVCVCLAAWMSHRIISGSAAAVSTLSTTAVASPAPPSVSAPPTLSISSTLPPLTAFMGVPPPVTGSVGTRRTASALRTLPHNQVAMSSTSSYRGPRRSFPAGGSPFSPDATLLIVFYPMVIPGVHEPAGYGTITLKARNDNMAGILVRLHDHHLVFNVTVPRSGMASPTDFTRQIVAYFAAHNLSLPQSPIPLTDTESALFVNQPWALLSPTRRHDILTFQPHPTISASIFGYDEFVKLGKKFKHPDPARAARFGPVYGPIDHPTFSTQDLPVEDSLTLRHACFPFRVVDGLPFANTAIPMDPQCLGPLCPSVEPIRMATPPPLPLTTLIRPRASSQSSPSIGRRVRQCPAPINESLLLPPPPTEPSSASPPHSPAIQQHIPVIVAPSPPAAPPQPPLEIGRDIARLSQVTRFQNLLQADADRAQIPFIRRFNLHALDIDSGARGVIDLLLHLHRQSVTSSGPYVLPAGVVSCSEISSTHSFFRSGHAIRVGVGSRGEEISFGPGPERAVYRQAVAFAVSDHNLWQQAPSSGFIIPVFTPGAVEVPDRTALFRAHGCLLAIHCYTLGSAPLPVSIWLLLALCNGVQAMLVPKRHLAALDPSAYQILAPWFAFGPDDTLPTNLGHPFNQFLMNVMEIQPSMIASPRTQAVHDGWTVTFSSKVLLGSTTVFTHPEFRAIQIGFDVAIGNTRFLTRFTCTHGVLPLLACMYDRQVRKADDVSSQIACDIVRHADDGTTPYYGALFRLLLLRYLQGVGHPQELRGSVIDEEEWMTEVNNRSLRARLFLEAASDSNLLPSREAWRIKVHMVGLNPPTDPALASLDVNPRPIHFHTCTYEMEAKINRPMEDLLIAACIKLDDPSYVTVFDLWLHAQLLSRDHNTA